MLDISDTDSNAFVITSVTSSSSDYIENEINSSSSSESADLND